jgi:hypothetical protein
MVANHCVKVSRVIARRSRSNLTVIQDNNDEIAALPLVARNDEVGATIMLMGKPPAHAGMVKEQGWS